jgi:hypothetical protein
VSFGEYISKHSFFPIGEKIHMKREEQTDALEAYKQHLEELRAESRWNEIHNEHRSLEQAIKTLKDTKLKVPSVMKQKLAMAREADIHRGRR